MKKIKRLIVNGKIHSFESKNYYASKDGDLYKKLADNENSEGYINDKLKTDLGKNINITRHQVIAQTHLYSSYKDGYIVNHKNEDKTDNRAENLEWVSNAYNVIYSKRGLSSQTPLFDINQVGRIVEDEKTKAIKEVLHDLQEKGYIPPILEKMLAYEYTSKEIN